jgi:hypothetical protein
MPFHSLALPSIRPLTSPFVFDNPGSGGSPGRGVQGITIHDERLPTTLPVPPGGGVPFSVLAFRQLRSALYPRPPRQRTAPPCIATRSPAFPSPYRAW